MPVQSKQMKLVVGALPDVGTPPAPETYPFETVRPARDGYIENDGVKSYYAIFGEHGPWIAFAPIYQITHMGMLKATVPYLSQYFRVIAMDGRGNGKSDRPTDPAAYTFDHYYRDFVAVLDAAAAERVAVIGISATATTVLRIAAEQPERVTHVVIAGGFADSLLNDVRDERLQRHRDFMKAEWASYLDGFFSSAFSEPHSTKPLEDAVRFGWATTGEVASMARDGWTNVDVRELARRVRCPTLIVHGDDDRTVPYAKGQAIHELVPNARLLTIGGGGHLTAVRDPVAFNRALRDFIHAGPRTATWTRAMSRKRKVLFVSSAIGLGHVQRDLAITRELRKLQPELDVSWFTVDPATRYLEREGEHIHPMTKRLANESTHFECMAGEHDLSAFFALRTMDEIMINNFMTFSDLLEREHFDLVIGDEAWDVDYFYHENPELKRQPFVFLTDFIGCLPVEDDEREAHLCADRNADDLEHIARFPYVRDAAIFVGNRQDVVEDPFGPGLPRIRDWADRNFDYAGYTLPFDPASFADVDGLRKRLGYERGERIAIAAVGGTGVGSSLLKKIVEAFPRMKRQVPELRLVLVTGPRISPSAFPSLGGLDVKPYVHNLFEHFACCDLALVQGGLSTCMELVATRRPFLSFPLQRHFEQRVHVRKRLANYGADRALDYPSLTAEVLADAALTAMHTPVHYKPVETDGAARAAKRIAQVLENRHWIHS
jgi:pimeloyl-ACP methyl ester carboxylesterase/predicted glycosyltransferase